MSNVKQERESNRVILILVFVAISVFGIVFFAARGRFNLPFGNQLVMTAVAPFQRAAGWAAAKVNGYTTDIWDILHVHEQNKLLRHEVEELRIQNVRANEYAAENIRLRSMLNYKQAANYFELLPARVIGREAANWTKMIVIDRGTNDGVQKNMAVITERGLVGCIVEAGPLTSKVELILDPRASVGTLVQRSRLAGIVSGDFDNPMQPRMRNLPRNVDIREGDNIVTSGFGGVYPKGIFVGRVQSVKNDAAGLLQYAVLETAVDFDKLEDVAVITVVKGAPPEPEPAPKQTPGTETDPKAALAARNAPPPAPPKPNTPAPNAQQGIRNAPAPAGNTAPVTEQAPAQPVETPQQAEAPQQEPEQPAPKQEAPAPAAPAPKPQAAPAADKAGAKR